MESQQIALKLKQRIEAEIFGQEDLILETLCCLLAGGHILMTGAPGLAKTTLVRVVAQNLGLGFGRIQFTPDLLPSDIVGTDVLDMDTATGKRTFTFAKGPIFANLLLADEINRASPRTQSALLEAMQERNVTAGGKTHALPSPFMVFATQNPFESEGTFPLPEAQMDRFLLHSLVRYPNVEAEEMILRAHASNKLIGETSHQDKSESLSAEHVAELIRATSQVGVDDELIQVIRKLVRLTRPDDESCPENLRGFFWYGAGPRAGLSLISTAKALALLDGSDRVRWRHIKRLSGPALRHRIKLTPAALNQGITEDSAVESLVKIIEDEYTHLAQGVS
jgi:MoxR-like ATPase